jgi:hypothetical protein
VLHSRDNDLCSQEAIGRLIRARCKQLTLGAAHANTNRIDRIFENRCPCCKSMDYVESEFHLLFRCTAFAFARATIEDIIADIGSLVVKYKLEDESRESSQKFAVALLLGGGRQMLSSPPLFAALATWLPADPPGLVPPLYPRVAT